MILTKRTLWLFLAMACFCVAQVSAQTFTEMTLNFSDVTSTNIVQAGGTQGEDSENEKEVEFGDYDNDGDIDCVMAVAFSDFGQRHNKLYRNTNGVLMEVSGPPVIDFQFTDTTRSVYFRDYTNDGFLDIIAVNDSNSGTANNNSPGKTKLFINNGDGTFTNSSQDLSNQTGAACNGVSEDFDRNGLYDLMMCNYPNISQDSLSLNGINGDAAGEFTVVTSTHYPAESRYGVHAEGADFNNDGLIDIAVTNQANSQQFIYYNNLNGMGSGDGDFRYPGGQQQIPEFAGGAVENGMFPADFDCDGDMDIYFANYGMGGGLRDAILENTGNAANGFANFSSSIFETGIDRETLKVEATDLDKDGKPDLIVMALINQGGSSATYYAPKIYRNVSTLDEIRFVEWTEDVVDDTDFGGWHGNAADITGNGRCDVLFGSDNDDHLVENLESPTEDFDNLVGGVVPNFHNGDPIAIVGEIAPGETKTMIILGGASGVPAGSRLSMIARSDDDIDVVVKNGASTVASSARAAYGHEGLHYETPTNNNLTVEITNNSKGGTLLGDLNGDGEFNLLDVQPFVDLISSAGFDPAGDFNGDGMVNLLDVGGFVDGLSGGGGGGAVAAPFIIEFLSN